MGNPSLTLRVGMLRRPVSSSTQERRVLGRCQTFSTQPEDAGRQSNQDDSSEGKRPSLGPNRIQTEDVKRGIVGPGKVARPSVSPRVKQRNHGSRFVISTLCVTPLVGIAVRAGQREVLWLRRAPDRSRSYVVYWKPRHLSLGRQKAILTTPFCAGSHERSKNL